MSLNLATQQLLSDGKKYFSYSGVRLGDITLPATITLLTIDNTGLRDSLVKIQPFFGRPIATGTNDPLGLLITIDGIEVVKQLQNNSKFPEFYPCEFELFVPRQSSLEILSINTSNNNLQERGCNLIGWYL
jgi:hypothetical protein|tara:strand:+ start:1261 stop:1653 length:393 start_codon:yes stop_codon:yes gene_type:complete